MSMKGRELVHAVFRHEKVPVIPWVPYTGIHAGKVKGYTAPEVLRDSEKLFESVLEINRLYDPDGQTTMFDLQLEAEILGCGLCWSDFNLPMITSHPLAENETVPREVPQKSQGRLPLALETVRRFRDAVGDKTAAYGLFCGPFTLASHLRGTQMFRDMTRNPEYVRSLLAYTGQVSEAMCDYYHEAGADVLAAVDPLVSQISPRHFAGFLSEPYKKLFDHIRELGALSSFFVCGNAAMNLGPMCGTGPDSVAIDENVDIVQAKKITDGSGIVLCGNIPLTTVMLYGSQQANMKYPIDIIDRLTEAGMDPYRNLVISPGCDMPYDIPPENAIAAGQAVHNPESARRMVAGFEEPDFGMDIDLPDYACLRKPLMEVFTLDPVACAACTYMLAAAEDAKLILGDRIDMAAYRYTVREDIARMKKMGVSVLPSIYIDGELKYPSLIPERDELVAELEKRCRRQKG